MSQDIKALQEEAKGCDKSFKENIQKTLNQINTEKDAGKKDLFEKMAHDQNEWELASQYFSKQLSRAKTRLHTFWSKESVVFAKQLMPMLNYAKAAKIYRKSINPLIDLHLGNLQRKAKLFSCNEKPLTKPIPDLEKEFEQAILLKDIVKVEAMLNQGIDPNLHINGKSILSITLQAFFEKHDEKFIRIMRLLINHRANVNVQTYQQSTLLIDLAKYGLDQPIFLEMATCLIGAGIPIDKQNQYGDTALHWAVSKKNWPLSFLLLSLGANPFMSNRTGSSPCKHLDNANLPMGYYKTWQAMRGRIVSERRSNSP